MTDVELKPVEEQTIVITGASSGIGLATARMAAERGANVVLAARSEDALEELSEELSASAGDATHVVADVSEREDVEEIATVAEEEYEGFDTWINVAAVFIYGRLDETPIEDMREQFEVNVWGTLYGALEAADRLKEDVEGETGGAIINIGSVASDRAIPLQGSYSASKHAVKGFTDSLRMELEEENAPVSVTLIKPTSVDTPYPEHAKNYMDEEPDLPSPAYSPETVARAILNAAEEPERDVLVGGGAKAMTTFEKYASGLLDTVMERTFFDQQRRDEVPRSTDQDIVEEPVGDLEERGSHEGYVAERSLYTRLSQNRSLVTAGLATVAAGAAYLRRKRRREARGGLDLEAVRETEVAGRTETERSSGSSLFEQPRKP